MHQEWVPNVIFGWNALWVASLIMLATYAIIMMERLNRAIVALVGAALMVMLGVLNQQAAFRGIDFNTIALLTGMMIIVNITRKCGIFQYIAIRSAKWVKASPWGILLMLSWVTAIVSALLDNVTTVLLIVPVTLAITKELQVPPYPFLFAEVLASNIGGTATLIGDPPNILIGSAVGLSFNEFVVNLTPVIILVMIVQGAMTHFLWGRTMHSTTEHRAAVMAFKEREAITDPLLLKQSMFVLAVVIFAFVIARGLHLEPGTIAMSGAALLLLLDNYAHAAEHQSRKVTEALSEVEWITIFFFMGLFIVVYGVEVSGLLKIIADWLIAQTGGDLALTGYVVLWASAVLSAIIDNIPFVATMIPLIKNMATTFGGPEAILPLWWCLSLGACLGGNGTLVGASANLTVMGLAERNGIPFRFWVYTKYAFPMMLVSVAISHVYVWLRYFS